MDVRHINPILTAFSEIIPQIGFNTIVKTKISLVGSNVEYSGVLINIGLYGTIKGVVLIGMSIDSAMSFASKMMMGMEVSSFDSLAQSAISEMGNMVCANACTQFNNIGICGLEISPPTVMISEFGTATLPVNQIIMISFIIDSIDVNVYVGLM
jgi:chemotaxis protein CheX